MRSPISPPGSRPRTQSARSSTPFPTTKTDPDVVVTTLRRWHRTGGQAPGEMQYLTRHATRTLVKTGHPETLALLGVDADAAVTLVRLHLPDRVALGADLEFALTLRAEQDGEAIVDYMLHFPGPSGELTGRKTYKLSRVRLTAGDDVDLVKHHRLRAGMTTRTIRPGEHEVEILINGRSRARRSFVVTAPEPG